MFMNSALSYPTGEGRGGGGEGEEKRKKNVISL